MSKQRFRKIEQHQTFTRRDQYENALTRDRAKNRAKSLSYVEIDIGDGEKANVYFLPIPGTALKLREAGLDPLEAYKIMIGILADCVVDPATGTPLYTFDEWEKEDPDFVGRVSGAVMGVQFISETEAETLPESEVIEVEDNDSGAANDPNPLGETVGSPLPTSSIENSALADHQLDGAEEMSKSG